MRRLSFKQKQSLAWVVISVMLFCVANYYGEWRILGGFNREAMILSFVLLFVYVAFIGPSIEEMQEHRNRKHAPQSATGFRPWIYLLGMALAMLIVAIAGPGLRLFKGQPILFNDWKSFFIMEGLAIVAGVLAWGPTKRFLNDRKDSARPENEIR